MLTNYQAITSQLLQNPAAPAALYATANLTTYINIARGQVAGEGKCVRSIGTLTAIAGQRNYNFSSISFGTVATTGIAGAINVRRITYNVGQGQKWINSKAWEWFDYYRLSNPVPVNGPPTEWAQFGQGSAGQGSITGIGAGTLQSGSFYLDPPPDLGYGLNLDCECYPQALAADTDVEAIPYLWTDAVPYFAAYLALMSSQTSQRIEQAQKLLQLYQVFVQRARNAANPDVQEGAYEQARDMVQANRLGMATRGADNAQ